MIEITAVRLDGGDGHEHISAVLWRSAATALACASRQSIVDWLSESSENEAIVGAGARVRVVSRPSQPSCLRARADGVWTDDLLSLPRF